MKSPDEQISEALLAHVQSFAPNFYAEVRNPKWSNAEHTRIDCEVNFHHVSFEVWTPFTANPDDYMPYSKQLFNECLAGTYGPVAEFVSLTAPVEESTPLPVQTGIVI